MKHRALMEETLLACDIGLDFGVKATHVTAMRPFRGEDAGRANVTLNMGGIEIRQGDYCYADRDCVIILDNPVHG